MVTVLRIFGIILYIEDWTYLRIMDIGHFRLNIRNFDMEYVL